MYDINVHLKARQSQKGQQFVEMLTKSCSFLQESKRAISFCPYFARFLTAMLSGAVLCWIYSQIYKKCKDWIGSNNKDQKESDQFKEDQRGLEKMRSDQFGISDLRTTKGYCSRLQILQQLVSNDFLIYLAFSKVNLSAREKQIKKKSVCGYDKGLSLS